MTRYVVVVVDAYLLAAIPLVFLAAAGRLSPVYRMPRGWYLRWWSRLACGFVVSAFLLYGVSW